jgi:hypothetical protein
LQQLESSADAEDVARELSAFPDNLSKMHCYSEPSSEETQVVNGKLPLRAAFALVLLKSSRSMAVMSPLQSYTRMITILTRNIWQAGL